MNNQLPPWCRSRFDPQGPELPEEAPKKRQCLKCSSVFASLHGNRVCDDCKSLPLFKRGVHEEGDCVLNFG